MSLVSRGSLWLGVVFSGLAVWMIFFWVPTEINQGAVQRILYFHVPTAWVSMAAIIGVAGASLAYLRTNNRKWDNIAVSMAEVGVMFGVLMLLSGMIWARPVWGVFWTGEAKLTTAAILVFLYAAYLMFRAYFPPGTQRSRAAAVIALLGAVDAPIIYFAAQLWERSHPGPVVGPAASDESAFAAELGLTLLVSTLAFTFIFVRIVYDRYRIRSAESEVEEVWRSRLLTQGGID